MHKRGAGVLLHITSLPSPYGLGDMGPGARVFLDFLARAGQSCWQILPLTPTSSFIGDSPYSSDSAFAGNPLLISPELMAEDGWITSQDLGVLPDLDPSRAAYPEAASFKNRLLDAAFAKHGASLEQHCPFTIFRTENAHWLDDYCLFKAIKHSLGGLSWTRWPRELRDRDPAALAERAEALSAKVVKEAFVQFLFSEQWSRLKEYASKLDILIIGDAPIYVTQDSADVWSNPGLFKLGPDKEPLFVAGVPPDYFSKTGQRWGNPVYDWAAHKTEGFSWWIKRLAHNFKLYDLVRLDHFRGFAGYWEIPAEEETAENGSWVDAPGPAFFKAMLRHFPVLPILAEDLGVITPDVRELRDGFGFPGMKVLQFAFGHGVGENRDAPHHHVENSVAYTGTHDNNTTLGWFKNDASEADRKIFFDYIGREMPREDVPWAMVRLAYMSVSKLAIVPMQDLLGLGQEARMNMPSKAKGNWTWRCGEEGLNDVLATRLEALATLYGRGR
ncbi:MAG: 4-alpha-glucanotransferase [Desulfovibrio sp.]|nr:4-alpha-glucanotransferase [Desulfovibrio sp.]MBI4960883.1 4-alpha-glucanotransferase [Desulfovibrio sp.]